MEEQNYPELKEALMKFRELFQKNILPHNVVAFSKDFLHRMRLNGSWSQADAVKVYNLIAPYQDKLLKVGFDFQKVPKIKVTLDKTQQRVRKKKFITYEGGRYIVKTPYNTEVLKGIRKMPGRVWNNEKKQWEIPLDQSENLLHFAHAYSFHIGEKAEKRMLAVKNNLEASYQAEAIDLNIPLKLELLPFQTSGTDYMIKNMRVINADDMGLGKTVQAIATLKGTESFPAIIICPKSLRYNWKDEFKKFTDVRAEVLDKKLAKNLQRYLELDLIDAVITNYEGITTHFAKEIKKIYRSVEGEIFKDSKVKYIGAGFVGYDPDNDDFKEMRVVKKTGKHVYCQVGKDKDNIIEVSEYDLKKVKVIKKPILNGKEKLFKGVVLDEAHEVRNKTTIRWKAINQVFENKDVRLALTGTPIVKGAEDLASILEMLSRIDEFGGRQKFLKAYSDVSKARKNGAGANVERNRKKLRELNFKLRSLCFIRREKHQVLDELPEKFRQNIRVEITNRKEYDHAYISIMDYLASLGTDEEQLSRALRAEMLVQINILKQLSAKGKMEAFYEFADSVMAQGQKLIVFTWFKETARKVLERYKGAVSVTGMDSDDEVERNKKMFQENPDTQMIVVSFKRGGVGHNLTAASMVLFLELGWTNKDHTQAEDRAHRIGQRNNVNVYYFLGIETVDEKIHKIIESRRAIEKEATGGTNDSQVETTTFKELTKELMGEAKDTH